MEIKDFRVTFNANEIPACICSLAGQPQEPASGDVLITHATPPIVLGDAREIHLQDTGRETGLLLMQSGSGHAQQKIACRVGSAFVKRSDAMFATRQDAADGLEGYEKIFVNPLPALTAAEYALLRGIRLETWDRALAIQLARIDWERCALSIDSEVLRACGGRLPPLPSELRYLLLEFYSWKWDDKFDVSSLSRFPELRVLGLQGASVEIDIGLLAGAKHLRVLHASGNRISGLQRLAELDDLRDLHLGGCDDVDDDSSEVMGALTRLRRLDLERCRKLTSVEFARPLARLEFIDLCDTAVTDLTALADLPSLKEIIAMRAPVRILPNRLLPNVHTINVMSTGLDPEAVAEFRHTHPNVQVLHGWADALRAAVTGANQVRVRSGGLCHRNRDEERTLVEESNEAEIEMLALSFEVDEAQSGGRCRCCGDPTIEFRRDGELVAAIGLHHGRSARWIGWPGDALLSRQSRRRLAAWLSRRGERSFAEGL